MLIELVEAQTGIRPTRTGRGVSMVVNLPIGTVGEDIAELKPRFIRTGGGRR